MVLLAKKRRYFEKEGDDNKITEIIAVKLSLNTYTLADFLCLSIR